MTGLVRTLRVDVDLLRRQSTAGFTLATEVADWLSRRGVPFAEAHEITGALVRRCEDRGIELAEIADADLRQSIRASRPTSAPASRPPRPRRRARGYGGTAPAAVGGRSRALRDTPRRAAALGRPAVTSAP